MSSQKPWPSKEPAVTVHQMSPNEESVRKQTVKEATSPHCHAKDIFGTGDVTTASRSVSQRTERDLTGSSKLKLLLEKFRLTFARTTGTRIDGVCERRIYAQNRSILGTVSDAVLRHLASEGQDTGWQAPPSKELAALLESLISAIKDVDAAERPVNDSEQQRIVDEYEITELFREVAPLDDASVEFPVSAKLNIRDGLFCESEMPDTVSELSASLGQSRRLSSSHSGQRKRLRGEGIEVNSDECSDDSEDDRSGKKSFPLLRWLKEPQEAARDPTSVDLEQAFDILDSPLGHRKDLTAAQVSSGALGLSPLGEEHPPHTGFDTGGYRVKRHASDSHHHPARPINDFQSIAGVRSSKATRKTI